MLTPDSRNANPRAPLTRTLSPHRRARLRRLAPHHEFRDRLVAPSEVCDVTVDTIRGARPLASLVADRDWP
jgi:hypothetical protein